MNTELSTVLKERLASLPFIDVLAGLVKTVEDEQPIEGGGLKRNKFPVAWDHNQTDDCPAERSLTPDSSRRSVLYFEDFGSQVGRGGRNGDVEVTSSIRLVGWLNRAKLTGGSQPVAGAIMVSCVRRVETNFINVGIFKRLKIHATRFPIADASLFSRYTYDEAVRQYLMPPFEVFGVDFTANFYVNSGCIADLDFSNPDNC